jgi:integrase
MATFIRLPSGNWRAQVRKAGHRSISETFPKKAEAKTWAETMEGNRDHIDAFPDAEARKRTVEQAIDGYMLEYSGRDVSIVRRMTWWKDHFGSTALTDFTAAKIKDGLRQLGREHAKRHAGKNGQASLGRKKAPATINRYHQSISSVLSWAVEESWLAKNPAIGLKRRQEPRGRVRYLSDQERAALLAGCDNSEWQDLGLFVRLALSTGARLGELLALTWDDIDLKAGLAYVRRSKNEEPRVLPLIQPVKNRLEQKVRPIKGGLLFPSIRDAKRPYVVRKPWDAAVAAAKLKNFRFHDLRHSCASYLAMNGATPLEIGDVLGHKTLAMVRRYSHLSTEHKKKLTERVLGGMVE